MTILRHLRRMSTRDNYYNNEPEVQPFNDIQGESIPPPAYTPYEQQQHSQQNLYTSPTQTSFPVASIPTSSGYAPPDHPHRGVIHWVVIGYMMQEKVSKEGQKIPYYFFLVLTLASWWTIVAPWLEVYGAPCCLH